MPGCEARWVCTTEDEIMFQVAAHAASTHGLVEVSSTMAQAVRAAIAPVV
ncbi:MULTISPECIES: DUF1059 domain-containing protein [Cryobacterium]|nr:MULTISPECIES: DUF1059 domain-containing protein [Cryobacterium]